MVGWEVTDFIPLVSVISASTGLLHGHLHLEECSSGPKSHLFRPKDEGFPPVAPQILIHAVDAGGVLGKIRRADSFCRYRYLVILSPC